MHLNYLLTKLIIQEFQHQVVTFDLQHRGRSGPAVDQPLRHTLGLVVLIDDVHTVPNFKLVRMAVLHMGHLLQVTTIGMVEAVGNNVRLLLQLHQVFSSCGRFTCKFNCNG